MTTPDGVAALLAQGLESFSEGPGQSEQRWKLHPATIQLAGAFSPIGVFDGDGVLGLSSTPVPLTSLIGFCAVDDRVMILVTPGGNYVISNLTRQTGSPVNVNAESGVNSTTSGAYADYSVAATLSLTKYYDATNLLVTFTPGFYVNDGNTGPDFAVSIDGTDYKTHHVRPAMTVASHKASVGIILIPNIAADTYTINGRWRRAAGAGTVQCDNNDWFSLTVQEVA